MPKKIIIRIGVALLAITLVALLVTVFASVSEGIGGIPIAYSRTGKPSVFLGVAYLPVFLIALVIAGIYLWYRLRKYCSTREHEKNKKA